MEPENCKSLKHYNTPGHAHELTFSCYRRQNYLLDAKACELFLEELQLVRSEGLVKIWAYVLMPNHVHVLLWPLERDYSIDKILNDLKGRMAKKFRDHIMTLNPDKFKSYAVMDKSKKRTVFRFWQPGCGFDRNLWNAKAIHHVIEYIEANPVRKGLVSIPEEYRWSSAFARVNNVGVVPDSLDIPVVMLNPQYQRIGVI